MPNAQAKYVISAQDQTKAAIESIKRNFESLNEGVNSVVRGVNILTTLTVGGSVFTGFRRLTEGVLSAAAAANGPFADALASVKSSFQELLTPQSGMAAATASLQELDDVLQSPEIRAAANSLTGDLILGFSKAASAVAELAGGMRELFRNTDVDVTAGKTQQERIDDLDAAIGKLQAHLADLQSPKLGVTGGIGIPLPLLAEYQKQITATKDSIAALLAQEQALIAHPPEGPGGQMNVKPPTFASQPFDEGPTGSQAFTEAMNQAQQAIAATAKSTDDYRKSYGDDLQQMDDDTQTAVEKTVAAWQKQQGEIQALQANGVITASEAAQRQAGLIDTYLQPITVDVQRQTVQMSQYAKEAAKNIQDAFANFLFDPFQNGLKGMLSGFVDLLRHMLANDVAAKIFGSQGGGLGYGNTLAGLFGGFFGLGGSSSGFSLGTIGNVGTGVTLPGLSALAGGGPVSANRPYLVGEQGPELFMSGSSGQIVPNSALGGVTFAPVYQIDARGGTTADDLARKLPRMLKATHDAAIKTMSGLKRGGKF